jgi:hypothetical protein
MNMTNAFIFDFVWAGDHNQISPSAGSLNLTAHYSRGPELVKESLI